MARCLVTGGAGFIGSHVAQWLHLDGHEVYVVDDLSGGFTGNVPMGVAFHIADCGNYQQMDDVFEAVKPEIVYHLAAYAAEGLSPFVRSYNYVNNVVGSANLISLAMKHHVRRFVFTSSAAVYGHGDAPFSEDDVNPIDPYGNAKLAIERDLEMAWQTHGLSYTIFRPHNVYGPRQNYMDPYRNVVGIFMRQAKRNEPMTIFGDGGQIRQFTDIDDVAPIIAQSAFKTAFHNETVNIGGNVPVSVFHLARTVAQIAGVVENLEYLPPRMEAHAVECSHSRLYRLCKEAAIPYSTPVGIVAGLPKMWEWVKANHVGVTELPPIEVYEYLPKSWARRVS